MMTHVESITPIVKLNLNRLCDYKDSYILVSGTIELTNTEAASNNRKSIINKTCASFVDCIIEINNTIHKQIMLKTLT